MLFLSYFKILHVLVSVFEQSVLTLVYPHLILLFCVLPVCLLPYEIIFFLKNSVFPLVRTTSDGFR